MDDLISRKAAIEALQNHYEVRNAQQNAIMDECVMIVHKLPIVPAVPLEPLCKFLAGIYGTPCQLGEIECYPQCEPDAEGMCLGMRSNDETCWRSYLTKWMKGIR